MMRVICAYTTKVNVGCSAKETKFEDVPPGTEIELADDEAMKGIESGRYYHPGDNPFVQPTMADTEEAPPSPAELEALAKKIEDAGKSADDAEADAEKRIAAANKKAEDAEAEALKKIEAAGANNKDGKDGKDGKAGK